MPRRIYWLLREGKRKVISFPLAPLFSQWVYVLGMIEFAGFPPITQVFFAFYLRKQMSCGLTCLFHRVVFSDLQA